MNRVKSNMGVILVFPQYKSSAMSPGLNNWKFRIILVSRVERSTVGTVKILHSEIKITSMDLGFTQEDQVWLIEVDDLSEVVDVTRDAFNVPGESTES